jgi:hypothetical protein
VKLINERSLTLEEHTWDAFTIDGILCDLLKDVTDLEIKTFLRHCLKTNIYELEKILCIWDREISIKKNGGKKKYYIDYGKKK